MNIDLRNIPPQVIDEFYNRWNSEQWSIEECFTFALAAWPEAISAKSVKDLFPNCIVIPLPAQRCAECDCGDGKCNWIKEGDT